MHCRWVCLNTLGTGPEQFTTDEVLLLPQGLALKLDLFERSWQSRSCTMPGYTHMDAQIIMLIHKETLTLLPSSMLFQL